MLYSSADRILRSRRALLNDTPAQRRADEAAEGGCGVLGFTANIPVAGRHVLAASAQMHNRGNGKGGGIAMVGLVPEQAGVEAGILRTHYLIQIAFLERDARREVEEGFIHPYLDLAAFYEIPHMDDFRAVPGLEVQPPEVWRYFARVKPEVLERFAAEHGLQDLTQRAVEDEFIYQNSFRLNTQFYASLGEKSAFVLSHGRNLSVLKIVGYAEQVVQYYRLEEQRAHVWIAHQRYPTKGRVWHPGGAHPFIGLNEALVHNGDFANYHAVGEYLRQREIGQLFLTDTEVSVQLFDLWERVYGYPLEITLEAMAPTTEHDFAMLPPEKRRLYQAIQRTHIHGSPDGPWFFILARSLIDDNDSTKDRYELLGITDTSMLRPQVFALYENKPSPTLLSAGTSEGVQIGLIASERQAINACLRSLAAEDERFQPVADRYWAARGGSHTDGGSFRFSFIPPSGELICLDKFSKPIVLPAGKKQAIRSQIDPGRASLIFQHEWQTNAYHAFDDGGAATFWDWLEGQVSGMGWDEFVWGLDWLRAFAAQGQPEWEFGCEVLTLLRDRRIDSGDKKRASLLTLIDNELVDVFNQVPNFVDDDEEGGLTPLSKISFALGAARRLTWGTRHLLSYPEAGQSLLLIDGLGFPAEGEQSTARWMVRAVESGWRRLLVYNWRGGRFAACGLGPNSDGVRVDLYGDIGDYAASGLEGAEVYLHGDGQDQLGQILKRGKLVIYGDAGQTFLYGAKGGEVYVLGSVAGRPLINAVGRPRAVINGTCLDYLAESFMAGDPHRGGGFVLVNGVTFDENGCLVELAFPYPGGNLFSLASGGAIFLRDPHHRVVDEQLNGGTFVKFTRRDWALIEPYLRENERLFGLRVDDLLTVDGNQLPPEKVYRKVAVRESAPLQENS